MSRQTGEVIDRNRYALDVDRCRFNDQVVLPQDPLQTDSEQWDRRIKEIAQGHADRIETVQGTDPCEGPVAVVDRFLKAALAGDVEKAKACMAPSGSQWLIRDIDFDPISKAAEVVKAFLAEHPQARLCLIRNE